MNQKWNADISSVWTNESWLYLAVVLEMFARRVIWLGGLRAPAQRRGHCVLSQPGAPSEIGLVNQFLGLAA
jgi:transposase InsO family protein